MQQYDAKKVTISFAGRVITGIMDGTFVTVERDTDTFNDIVGSSGEVVLGANNDQRGSIKITLLQTSPDVDFFYGKIAEYEVTGQVTPSPVLVRDQINGFLHEASEAWVLRPPDAEYGREPTGREITIRCANLINRSERT